MKKTGTKSLGNVGTEDKVVHDYQEHLDELIERFKGNGVLTYEEIINFYLN